MVRLNRTLERFVSKCCRVRVALGDDAILGENGRKERKNEGREEGWEGGKDRTHQVYQTIHVIAP